MTFNNIGNNERNYNEINVNIADSIERDLNENQFEMVSNTLEERAILVGLELKQSKPIMGIESSIVELEQLALTAGAVVVGKLIQRLDRINKAFYIGKGKLEDLFLLINEKSANLVIFDDELSGGQIRNLEQRLNVKVIDRTSLILDIFALRAKSMEGKLQVELAQLKYRLPRLIGMGLVLSRTGGGIGTRGPGEKKLETDRRHIRNQINELEYKLKTIEKRRDLQKARRDRRNIKIAALVGYTNSGKSTLFNKLTDSNAMVENKLFATLDPTIRKMILPNQQKILLVDTVGFINKLPYDLIEAFKSTLEEARYADILIHVVDSSNPLMEKQIETVQSILTDLDIKGKKQIIVFNKIDNKVDEMDYIFPAIREDKVKISALEDIGIDILCKSIEDKIKIKEEILELEIPFDKGNLISDLHNSAKVISKEYTSKGTKLIVEINSTIISKYSDFIV